MDHRTLPNELWLLICHYLGPFDLFVLSQVSKFFRQKRKVAIIDAKRAFRELVYQKAELGDLIWLKWADNSKLLHHLDGFMSAFYPESICIEYISFILGQKGHLAIAEWIKKDTKLPLHWDNLCLGACESGRLDIVIWSRNNGSSPGFRHVQRAKTHGRVNVVKWLSK